MSDRRAEETLIPNRFTAIAITRVTCKFDFTPLARLLNIVAASRLRVFILHLIGEVVHQFGAGAVRGVLLTVNVIGQ